MSNGAGLVAVVGASGGLGASTLALAVGRRLAATGPPAVVADLDLHRGGLEVTAGVEHLPGRRWDELAGVRGRVPPGLVLASLPVDDGCHVLSTRGGASPVPSDRAVEDVLTALVAGPSRVVVDVPATSPLLPALLGRSPVVVLIVGLRTRALADGDAALERVQDVTSEAGGPRDVRLVTRGGRAVPAVLDDLVAHLGVPHLHHLPDDAAVPRDAERGLFPGTGRDAVRRCADAVVDVLENLCAAS